MKCDKCKDGNLVASGEAFMSNPPQYANYCDSCGKVTLSIEKYGTKHAQQCLRDKLKQEWKTNAS